MKDRVNDQIVELIPGYLEGSLPENEKKMVDDFRKISPDNEALFVEFRQAWDSVPLLHEMEKYKAADALKKVNARLLIAGFSKWWIQIQRAAAILLLPLLIYSGYVTVEHFYKGRVADEPGLMQIVASRPGTITELWLPDSTKVWLNSDSELRFPVRFNGRKRDVTLKGEAFFNVAKNPDQPFYVHSRLIDIEVLGTSFNVTSYDDEKRSEVLLLEGEVSLSVPGGKVKETFNFLQPGQRAVYEEGSGTIQSGRVEIEKYISWREGVLIFRDDSMVEVVRKLSRWFNVDIIFDDPEIKSYVYTATFKNENLEQILSLLKLSAPIDFRIEERKSLPENEYSKQKIYLMKKKN